MDMNTVSNVVAAPVSAASRFTQLAMAAMLGLFVVGFVGFSHMDVVHNAGHDYRHSWRSPATDGVVFHEHLSERRVRRGDRRAIVRVVMTVLQSFSTVPLILQAETYENAAPAHQHDTGAAPATGETVAAPAHEHDADAWAPADGFERYAFTTLASVVSAVGFALVLVAASEFAGGIGSWRSGALWGLAVLPSSRWRPASVCRRSCRPCRRPI